MSKEQISTTNEHKHTIGSISNEVNSLISRYEKNFEIISGRSFIPLYKSHSGIEALVGAVNTLLASCNKDVKSEIAQRIQNKDQSKNNDHIPLLQKISKIDNLADFESTVIILMKLYDLRERGVNFTKNSNDFKSISARINDILIDLPAKIDLINTRSGEGYSQEQKDDAINLIANFQEKDISLENLIENEEIRKQIKFDLSLKNKLAELEKKAFEAGVIQGKEKHLFGMPDGWTKTYNILLSHFNQSDNREDAISNLDIGSNEFNSAVFTAMQLGRGFVAPGEEDRIFSENLTELQRLDEKDIFDKKQKELWESLHKNVFSKPHILKIRATEKALIEELNANDHDYFKNVAKIIMSAEENEHLFLAVDQLPIYKNKDNFNFESLFSSYLEKNFNPDEQKINRSFSDFLSLPVNVKPAQTKSSNTITTSQEKSDQKTKKKNLIKHKLNKFLSSFDQLITIETLDKELAKSNPTHEDKLYEALKSRENNISTGSAHDALIESNEKPTNYEDPYEQLNRLIGGSENKSHKKPKEFSDKKSFVSTIKKKAKTSFREAINSAKTHSDRER